jgi:hypothetical protein
MRIRRPRRRSGAPDRQRPQPWRKRSGRHDSRIPGGGEPDSIGDNLEVAGGAGPGVAGVADRTLDGWPPSSPELLDFPAPVGLQHNYMSAPPTLFAYIDPGSGALVWQALVAAFVGAAYYFRHFLGKLTGRDRRSASTASESGQESPRD